MALHLQFAPHALELLGPFAAALRGSWSDPMVPPVIIVPGPAAGKWLKLRLTEHYDCVLNLAVETLERFLWNELQPGSDMEILHQDHLQNVICAMLAPERLGRKEFGPVAEYLKAPGGEMDPAKRVQLAAEIAHLFLEYEYNRPSVWDPGTSGRRPGWRVKGVDITWESGAGYFAARAGNSPEKDSIEEHEAWQRILYCEVFGKGGPLDPSAAIGGTADTTRYISLPRLYRIRHTGGMFADRQSGGPVFLWLAGKISHFHRNLLLELSQSRDYHVFLVNPCSEFWEDVDTTRGRKGRRAWQYPHQDRQPPIGRMESSQYEQEELGDTAAASSTPEHRLLGLWGHTGKENITLWCQAVDYNFTYTAGEQQSGTPATRLAALQQGLLLRDDTKQPSDPAETHSLRILASPEPGREVETLRDNLYSLMKEHPAERMRFDDIAVYLPDPARYLPYIHKVFGGPAPYEDGFIPYTVLGVDGGESLFARAVRDVLVLCGGGFSRAAVFSLLRNPLVLARLDLTRQQLDIWEQWAARMHADRGYDAAHRAEMGDAATLDLHTFGAAIGRLLLGPLASEPVALGLETGAPADTGLAPYRDFDTSDSGQVERFCACIERLAAGCRGFTALCRNGAGPSALCDGFLGLTDEWVLAQDPGESHCRAAFRGALRSIELQGSRCGREGIGFDEFRQWALGALRGEIPGSAAAWTGALTFAPLRPGMVLPHRVIFALGLDADAFPGVGGRTPLNLLGVKRIVGDPDPVRDNRYTFLELLCAARQRLVLSYRSQDIQRDRPLQPSSVVLELASVAGIDMRLETGARPAVEIVPLVGHEQARESGGSWDPADARLAEVGRQADEEGRAIYRTAAPVPVKRSGASPGLRTTVNDIKQFLVNPLEYHLGRTLELRDEEGPDTMAATDEPLENDFLVRYGVKDRVLSELVQIVYAAAGSATADCGALGTAAEKIVERLYDELRGQGLVPEAAFAALEAAQLCAWARTAAEGVAQVAAAYPGHTLYLDTGLDFRTDGVAADYRVEVEGYAPVALSMRIPIALRAPGNAGPLVLVKMGAEKKKDERAKDMDQWLNAFLFKLSGVGSIHTVTVQHADGAVKGVGADWPCPSPWDPARALRWLRELLEEMLEQGACEHVPAVLVEAAWMRCDNEGMLDNGALGRVVAETIEDDAESSFSLYHPRFSAMGLTELHVPGADELAALVKRRLSPVLKGVWDDHGRVG